MELQGSLRLWRPVDLVDPFEILLSPLEVDHCHMLVHRLISNSSRSYPFSFLFRSMLLWSTLSDLALFLQVVHLELVQDLFFLPFAHVPCLFAMQDSVLRGWLETCCKIISIFSAEGNLTSKLFLDQFCRLLAQSEILGQRD